MVIKNRCYSKFLQYRIFLGDFIFDCLEFFKMQHCTSFHKDRDSKRGDLRSMLLQIFTVQNISRKYTRLSRISQDATLRHVSHRVCKEDVKRKLHLLLDRSVNQRICLHVRRLFPLIRHIDKYLVHSVLETRSRSKIVHRWTCESTERRLSVKSGCQMLASTQRRAQRHRESE